MKADISSGKVQTQFVYMFSFVLHRQFCDHGASYVHFTTGRPWPSKLTSQEH